MIALRSSRVRCKQNIAISGALTASFMLGLVVGCGGRNAPDLVAVRGRLMLNGKPLAGKNVFFSPEEGTPGNGAYGRTDSNGSFELIAVIGGSLKLVKGARLGTYRVTVSDIEEFGEDGTPLPPVPVAAVARIPDKYLSAATSPLRVDVVHDMTEVVLDLKSK